ncbi:MAG: protein kinase [Myxococcota bacterium]|nr:protein kinase [Myxococcota bacterium]
MSALEFLERLPSPAYEERWLVRSPDSPLPRVAWFFVDEDRTWLEAMSEATARWVGFGHPRIARVFASSWSAGRAVFEIEDDRGPTLLAAATELADVPVERERWSVAQVIGIADGLAALRQHDPAFVHGRLEPHRMYVDPTGHARLRAPIASVSYGTERAYVGAGTLTGTARWMSPEQVQGYPLTAASDVFSLGSNLVATLTGHGPFDGRASELATLTAILQEPPAPLHAHTPGLAHVIGRALAKDVDDRYPDAAAFAAALRACVPDAGDYDAVISDRIAAWWPTAEPARGANHALGEGRCQQRWAALPAGDREDIRRCESCGQDVVHVRSFAAVVPLIGQRCVAHGGRPR